MASFMPAVTKFLDGEEGSLEVALSIALSAGICISAISLCLASAVISRR